MLLRAIIASGKVVIIAIMSLIQESRAFDRTLRTFEKAMPEIVFPPRMDSFSLRFHLFILARAKSLGWQWLAKWARCRLKPFKAAYLDNFGMTLRFSDDGVMRINTDGSPYEW